MKKFAILAVVVLTAGCAYIRSFQGPPGGEAEPLIGIRSYSYMGDNWMNGGGAITIRILQSDRTRPYCTMQAFGIDCEFPSAYLLSFANMMGGGWRGLTVDSARGVCADGLWTVPSAPRDAVQQCAFALVEMRFREAAPPEDDRNR